MSLKTQKETSIFLLFFRNIFTVSIANLAASKICKIECVDQIATDLTLDNHNSQYPNKEMQLFEYCLLLLIPSTLNNKVVVCVVVCFHYHQDTEQQCELCVVASNYIRLL